MRSDREMVRIGELTWGERELAQIIRRKMITREVRNKKKYYRKEKHKQGSRETSYFFAHYIHIQ